MTSDIRAMLRRMTPEERAEMRRHEKALADEVLSWKLAASAEMNAMTPEERLAHYKKIGDEYRAGKAARLKRLNVAS